MEYKPPPAKCTSKLSKRRTMSTLERAIVIAAEGHSGVKDKGAAPYILHPLRMMLTLSSPDERMSAWVADSLKALDLKRRLEKRTSLDAVGMCKCAKSRSHHSRSTRGHGNRSAIALRNNRSFGMLTEPLKKT
jgi:hypothetical protein